MRKVGVLLIIVLVVGIASLSGCSKKGSKVDYEQLYSQAQSDLKDKTNENNNLKDVLSAYDDKYRDMTDIGRYTYLPDGEKSYVSINNKILLDNSIKFDSSEPIANSATIKLTDSISISPSETWTFQTTTANTQMYNENGIAGILELCTTNETIDNSFMYDKYFKEFAGYNGFTNESRRTLFIGSSMSGIEVSWKVNITDNVYGSEKRKVKNKDILTSSELESLQASADESVAESESARMAEYNATLESTEAQTDSAGETAPAETVPETKAHAEDVGNQETEVVLPTVKQETYPATLRIGLVMFGDKALVYKFVYKNTGSSTGEELTSTLIKSIAVDGVNLGFDK